MCKVSFLQNFYISWIFLKWDLIACQSLVYHCNLTLFPRAYLFRGSCVYQINSFVLQTIQYSPCFLLDFFKFHIWVLIHLKASHISESIIEDRLEYNLHFIEQAFRHPEIGILFGKHQFKITL